MRAHIEERVQRVDAAVVVEWINQAAARDLCPPVAAWLERPALVRVIGPRYDPAHDRTYHMSGGSLAEWFDVIVHCHRVTPTRPLELTLASRRTW